MAKESTIVESFTLPSKGLIYDTPIADDVIGRLTNEEVLELLEKIRKL